MKKALSQEAEQVMAEIAKALGGGEFHVTQPYVCDHCQDEAKEAFPYGVYSASGKFWNDLCNDCFEALGCRYDWTDSNDLDLSDLPDEFWEEEDESGPVKCVNCQWQGDALDLAEDDYGDLFCPGCGSKRICDA